jgi:signal transduction histidine kinase
MQLCVLTCVHVDHFSMSFCLLLIRDIAPPPFLRRCAVISNAIKHCRRAKVSPQCCEGGEGLILLSARFLPSDDSAGPSVHISVKDNGPGIDVERQADIFKPFSQVRTGSEAIGGTGLGASVASASIMELLR